jgi:hypothetical protein
MITAEALTQVFSRKFTTGCPDASALESTAMRPDPATHRLVPMVASPFGYCAQATPSGSELG